MSLRIIFAGTPDFAAVHLHSLLTSQHEIIAVYTQPDRPAGRGKKLTASPVKEIALAKQIPVYQPENFKSIDDQQTLKNLDADLMVVVAYGLILPEVILNSPRLGCINVHASLLPRWRGAAPIQRAIEAGDEESGVTIMQMDKGLDTGDMLLTTRCDITSADTGGSLHDKLITIGCPALLRAVDLLEAKQSQPQKQPEAGVTYAAKLNKEEAALNWNLPAIELERKIRAFNPFPVAHTKIQNTSDDQRIRLWKTSVSGQNHNNNPGEIIQVSNQGLVVACGEGCLQVELLQLPGKKILPFADILRGHPDLFKTGEQLEIPV